MTGRNIAQLSESGHAAVTRGGLTLGRAGASVRRMRRPYLTLGLLIGVTGTLLYESLPPRALPMPPAEAAFIATIEAARAGWVGAPNDLARVGQRTARGAALCQALPGLAAANWSVRITSIAPNNLPDLAGKATAQIVIALSPDITLTTPSNPLTNMPGSMVEDGSAIYATARTLRARQAVIFSGTFNADSTDCMAVTNLFSDGAMRAPDFRIVLMSLAAMK